MCNTGLAFLINLKIESKFYIFYNYKTICQHVVWHNIVTTVKKIRLKKYLLIAFIICSAAANAQKIDSIYINLYTDSLKKGTYNYINVDGLFSNGSYLPLDSTHIIFTASAGKFSGNSLWIDNNFTDEKVTIKVVLKQNPSLHKEFEMYIKRKQDGPLRTVNEILNEIKNPKKKKKNN